jgi:GNAT superfamily N-acetyltransferase
MTHSRRLRENQTGSISLDLLANYPKFVPIVAEWIFDEWGHRDPDNSLELILENVKSRLNTKSPPIALIGLIEGKPVASSSILIRELDPFPQYKYWLASVYVLSEFRNLGIGTAVVELSAQIGADLGIHNLYLYTHSHENFYTKLGFKPVERPIFQGRTIVIMKRVLVPELSP